MSTLKRLLLVLSLPVLMAGCGGSAQRAELSSEGRTAATPAANHVRSAPMESAHFAGNGTTRYVAGDDGAFPTSAAEAATGFEPHAIPTRIAATADAVETTARSPATVRHTEPARSFRDATPPDATPHTDRDGAVGARQQMRHVAPPSGHQPGTLTAGSLDDHADYADFRDYLARALQSGGHQFPALRIGERVVIHVESAHGDAVGDAHVTVHAVGVGGSYGEALLDVATGSDGRALFLSEWDAAGFGPEFLLTVTPPGTDESVAVRVRSDQSPWVVTLPVAEPILPTQLDLALVVDTTGSMGDELEYLKVEIDHIAGEVRRRFPNVDQRYALVLYRDRGDQYVTRTFDFTGSLEEFRRRLAAQSAAGGGDYPEAMHLALEQSAQLAWRPRQCARVLFLVGDAPPHNHDAPRALRAVDRLRDAGVTIFPVAASGVRDQAEFVMRSAAFLTQGQYLFLTDHSGVGHPHARPQTPAYRVERLNELMIRMIASELSGEPALPRDVIAVETGAGDESVHRPAEVQNAPQSPATRFGETQAAALPVFPELDRIVRWLAAVACVLLLWIADVRWCL